MFGKKEQNTNEIEINFKNKPPIPFVFIAFGLGSAAFLTGLTFIPAVANNIGPFEMFAALAFGTTFIYYVKNKLSIYAHITIKVLFIILIVAIISLPNLADRIEVGGIQLLLLAYTLVLVLVMYNLLIIFPALMVQIFRAVAIGAAIAGIWVFVDGIFSGLRISTGGPFRNRAHIGIYMLTAFWMNLVYFYWPNTSKFDRILAILGIFISLYGIAVSGRRSAYLSLFVGLAILGLSFIIVQGADKYKMTLLVVVAGVGLALFSIIGSQYIPQLSFFAERVTEIDDRLESAVGADENIEDSENFILLQRQGMLRGVADHPILGIGWGGFYNSVYSPTGHEMHSTPQRFLVELGFIGFGFYLIYNIFLWIGSARLFFRFRSTSFQLPTFILMVALWSLSISWAYNRSITERTYWLLIIVFISIESLLTREWQKRQKPAMKIGHDGVEIYSLPQHQAQRKTVLFPGQKKI